MDGEGRRTSDVPRLTQLDFDRAQRKGVPEVVLAEHKSPEQGVRITRAFVERTGRALVSRMRPEVEAALRAAFADCELDVRGEGRVAAVRGRDYQRSASGGRVGVLTAGTSDAP